VAAEALPGRNPISTPLQQCGKRLSGAARLAPGGVAARGAVVLDSRKRGVLAIAGGRDYRRA